MKKHWIVRMEPLAGSSTSNMLRLLWQNKFRIHPKYWYRFYIAMRGTMYFLPLRLIERIRFNRKIKRTKIIHDPLFIIGHWRTGTTYLNTLLSRDKRLGYVTNLETYSPHFFLSFRRFTKRLVDFALPETRPMDNVRMGSSEPAEEEFALGAFDKYGFYNGFIFPRNFDLYSKYLSFSKCSAKDVQRWKKRYYYFLQKMTFKHKGKMLVLKNPPNTPRIKYLFEMFPNAKFIYLYRNPYFLYASTLRLFRALFPLFALQTWDDEKIQEGFLRNYKEMHETFERDSVLIPRENIIEISYEDFISSPMKALERIYQKFRLPGFEVTKKEFADYINSQASYQPNIHNISNDIIIKVNKYWDKIREKFGYERLEPS